MYPPYQPQFGIQPQYPTMQQPLIAQPQVAPRSGISGRIVDNIEDVTANEVPLDGSVALFPSSNGSQIFAKAWNGNGTISTVRYVPDVDEQKDAQPTFTITDIMDSLDDIRDLISELKKPAKRTTKKEAADDASD